MREPLAFVLSPNKFSKCRRDDHRELFSPCSRNVRVAGVANEDVLIGVLYPEPITAAALASSDQVFEPVLNVPALGTFLFISIVFTLLQIRTSQVETAVQERNKALANLRRIKSLELTEEFQTSTVEQALEEFELAVQKEERLRNVIPGVARIVPPSALNDPAEQEARAAAKQFLGKEYDIGKEYVNAEGNVKDRGGDVTSGQLSSPAAIAVLATVSLSLLALLMFLGQDPMSTSFSTSNM